MNVLRVRTGVVPNAIVCALLVLASIGPAFAVSPVGVWATRHDKAHIRISPCGNQLCGTIVWLKNPQRNGQPKTDRHNPDRWLRSRPIVGLEILKGFRPARDTKNHWIDGSIYDPASGKTYHSEMTLEPDGALGVRGYIGWSVFGRTETWTQVSRLK
ncbi:MAG: DUF2147 domain-containing protein [Acidiferrobacteraceae bacterium]